MDQRNDVDGDASGEAESVALKNEIARLQAFIMQLAEHLAAASEVLSKVAERKKK